MHRLGDTLMLAFVALLPLTEIDRARLDQAAIGTVVEITLPAGDGCNTCTCGYRKVSEREVVETGHCHCTLALCSREMPRWQFKD